MILSSSFFLEACVLALLLWIAIVDVRTQMIPDCLNLLLFLLGVITVFVRGSVDGLALLLGVAVLGLQHFFSRGKAVGSGDVFLMLGIGLILPHLSFMILALIIAYASAAFFALVLLRMGRVTLAGRMPFAPFLAAGAGVAMVFGERILSIVR